MSQSVAELLKEEPAHLHAPDSGERQLTVRAVLVGCLVGGVVSCTNIYIGLKIGWTFGASIISAVLGFAFFRVFGKQLSVLETNITQTAGSAAGSMASAAGLVAAIPALEMLGHKISWGGLTLWALSVAYIGVFFAVPLRRQMVVIDRLRFPTGTATAETILAMFSDAGDALRKARALLVAGGLAGLFTLSAHFVPQLESPRPEKLFAYLICWAGIVGIVFAWRRRVDLAAVCAVIGSALLVLDEWGPAVSLVALAGWGFKMYLGPSLFGAGFLVGPRVSLSLLLGALLSWGLLGPIAQAKGWAPGPIMKYKTGVKGWLLWPGVALMVAEALTALALSWRTFLRALTMTRGTSDETESDQDVPANEMIPNLWWIGGLLVGTALASVIGQVVFGIQPWLTALAVALSAVLSVVAVRSIGETDINPVGGMGKVTQLVYGAIAPQAMTTNLMAAAVTGAGASQAGDMMQDLKTGHLLGASPRKQFLAQLAGVAAGIVFVVPVYALFTTGYELGGDKLPAPAALAWKAMAELLAQGLQALPPMAYEAVLYAALLGVVLQLARRLPSIAPYVPSGLAVGIAFLIPAYYSLVIVYGTVAWLIWRKLAPQSTETYTFAVASGLVAGEGLMGIVNAALTILGVGPLT